MHVHPGLLGWLGLDSRSFAREGPGWALPTEQRRETPQLAAPDEQEGAGRQLYLSLSGFHGYLELAAGAFLFVRGR